MLPFLEDGYFTEDPEKKRTDNIYHSFEFCASKSVCGSLRMYFYVFSERKKKEKLWAFHGECMWLDHCLSFGINETTSPEEHGPCIGLIFCDILCFFMFLVSFFSYGSCFPPQRKPRRGNSVQRLKCILQTLDLPSLGFCFLFSPSGTPHP